MLYHIIHIMYYNVLYVYKYNNNNCYYIVLYTMMLYYRS